MDVQKMKLYSFSAAPNPRRLSLFMAYKGIDIETTNVDLGKKEQLNTDYLAINPAGTVPTLVLDDGTALTDVIACCAYLESHLEDRNYIVGDSLTLAHIDAYVACDFAGWVKELIPDDCARLKTWYERIKMELN